MRIRLMLAIASLVAAFAVSGLASAHQTYGTTTSQNSYVCGKANWNGAANPTAIGVHPSTIYLDVRSVAEGPYLYSIWLYAEGNGHLGLQTKLGNKSIVDEEDIEPCTNSPTGTVGWGHTALTQADTLIF